LYSPCLETLPLVLERLSGVILLVWVLAHLLPLFHIIWVFSDIAVYSIAVGISIFLMMALDFEHPPASRTALGVAITGFSVDVLAAVITASVIIALAHWLLRKYIKELT